MMTKRQETRLKGLEPHLDELAKSHGYTEVKAGFGCTTNLELTWSRYFTEGGMGFSITFPDYIDDAPIHVLRMTLEAAMDAAEHHMERFDVPGALQVFLQDPSFRYRRRDQFLRRDTSILVEDTEPIKEAFDGLLMKGLLLDTDDVVVGWRHHHLVRYPIIHQYLHVIGISKIVTSCKEYPKEALEYTIWANVSRMRLHCPPNDDPRFQALLNLYPDRARVEMAIKDVGAKPF